MFGMFLALRGPLRPPECPQWLPVGSLEWGEKSREYMLLWADFIIAFWAATLIGDKVLQSEEIFRSSVCLSVCPPLWAIQPGLRPSQPGLRPSQPGLMPSQPGLRPSQLVLICNKRVHFLGKGSKQGWGKKCLTVLLADCLSLGMFASQESLLCS